MKALDLSGQKFGHLTVIERAPNIGRRAAYLCRCDCGNEKVVKSEVMVRGGVRSCGCLHSKHKIADLSGQVFGRLTAIAQERNSGRRVMWRCLCECGRSTIIRNDLLTTGTTRSCGCLRSDVRAERAEYEAYMRWMEEEATREGAAQ